MNFICYGAGGKDKPENTLIAIEHCVNTNKNWTIHIDIQLSNDGEIILFKENNTDKITGQNFEIKSLSFKEIKKLDAAYNFQENDQFAFRNKGIKIPSLKEVFEKFPKTKFIIDIHTKNIEVVDKLIKLIKANGLSSNIIITSKETHIISAFRNKETKWKYAATTVRARKIVYSNMFYLDSIIPVDAHLMIIPKCDKDSLFLRERIIAYCNQQEKQTWTWIFEGIKHDSNSILSQISNLEKQGLNGIFTSSPLKIQKALSSNIQTKIAS